MGNEKGDIVAKDKEKVDHNSKATAEMIANDAINNYRTVSSLGINNLIVSEYMGL